MPTWLYDVPAFQAALVIVAFVETLSLIGLLLTRRFVIPHLHYTADAEAVNDAVSGTVQAIGVFYGITVGLIAVAVWNINTNASDLVSREAASLGALCRDVSAYPSPLRDELRAKLREYTVFVIDEAWPAQKKGRGHDVTAGVRILNEFQHKLYSFNPASAGQTAMHSQTLSAYNTLIEYRRLRIEAVGGGLSGVMWAVIWVGAAISIGVAYFFNIPEVKLHLILIALMGGFLAVVLFMIVINDRPFYGYDSVPSLPYKLILDHLIDSPT